MKSQVVVAGVIAWVGVGALAIEMSAWEQRVWGFFPILAGGSRSLP